MHTSCISAARQVPGQRCTIPASRLLCPLDKQSAIGWTEHIHMLMGRCSSSAQTSATPRALQSTARSTTNELAFPQECGECRSRGESGPSQPADRDWCSLQRTRCQREQEKTAVLRKIPRRQPVSEQGRKSVTRHYSCGPLQRQINFSSGHSRSCSVRIPCHHCVSAARCDACAMSFAGQLLFESFHVADDRPLSNGGDTTFIIIFAKTGRQLWLLCLSSA